MTLNRALVLADVSAALLEQGQPSQTHNGNCFYRHPVIPTLRCGIGHLIPDALYNTEIEDHTVITLLKVGRLDLDPKYGTPSLDDGAFLTAIQSIHDEHPPQMWKERFDDLARSQ